MSCSMVAAIIFAFLFITKLYLKFTNGRDRSYTSLVGKTAIVTGANSGIGYITALEFAKRGGRVILACRNEAKAEEARKKIVDETGNKNVIVKMLNLSSLKSVRRFVNEINEKEDRLDVLVNNAGAGGLGKHITEDGLELTMQINYFSSFLLTNLLIGLLLRSAPSRIVNVSSLLAVTANLDSKNLNRYTSDLKAYSNSKLCNILFTVELAKKLSGKGVTVYSLHPGVVLTDIFRRVRGVSKSILAFFAAVYFKTPEEGAQTTIHCALAKNIEHMSGGHFHDCHQVKQYSNAIDLNLAEKVWAESEKMVKMTDEEKFRRGF